VKFQVLTGFDPVAVKNVQSRNLQVKVKEFTRVNEGVTWGLPRLCLGDMVGFYADTFPEQSLP
jgi:hypothetical protein